MNNDKNIKKEGKPKVNEKGQAVFTPLFSILWHIARPLIKIFGRIEFKGEEFVNNAPDGCIIIANHTSNWDPVFLALGMRRRMRFMAKQELFRNKIFGWIIEKLGAFPVARKKMDTQAVRQGIDCIKNGEALVIFPEGNRSKNGELLAFQPGAAFMAINCKSKVIPAYITRNRISGRRIVEFAPCIDVPHEIEQLEKKQRLEHINHLLKCSVLRIAQQYGEQQPLAKFDQLLKNSENKN